MGEDSIIDELLQEVTGSLFAQPVVTEQLREVEDDDDDVYDDDIIQGLLDDAALPGPYLPYPGAPSYGDWAADLQERPPSSTPTTYQLSRLAPSDQPYTHPGFFTPRPGRLCTLGEVRGLM